MISVAWHPSAFRELQAAKAWYHAQDPGVAKRFSLEVIATIERIRRRPKGTAEFELGLRRRPLRRFPYSLIYQLGDDIIQILVLAHQRRKPRYWRKRVARKP